MRSATLVLLAIGFLGTAAAADEIGIATLVKPQVHAFSPGEPPRDLVTRDPIERGLKVTMTGREALLQFTFTRAFGCGQKTSDGRRISGVLTIRGPSDAELGDRSRRCAPKVHFNLGKFFLALLPGEPPIDVDSPEAVSGVKGTYVRFLVDPRVGTFVGVDEGVVTVQAKAGGDPVEVEAGQWVVVPPGGLPTRPAPLSSLEAPEDSPLQLRDFTTEQPGRPPQ
ncbi:MAG: hypothetical protein ACJ76Y_11630 [Thermoanaerobaculia bacterium]